MQINESILTYVFELLFILTFLDIIQIPVLFNIAKQRVHHNARLVVRYIRRIVIYNRTLGVERE